MDRLRTVNHCVPTRRPGIGSDVWHEISTRTTCRSSRGIPSIGSVNRCRSRLWGSAGSAVRTWLRGGPHRLYPARPDSRHDRTLQRLPS